MAERRKLTDVLQADSEVDRARLDFVRNGIPNDQSAPMAHEPLPSASQQPPKGQTATAVGRAPLTIRFRADFAAILKRASLERQLQGIVPNTLQDMVEEAVEPWLRANGYLT